MAVMSEATKVVPMVALWVDLKDAWSVVVMVASKDAW